MSNSDERHTPSVSERRITLKLINSPLCGCEFQLTNDRTFFIVANQDTLDRCSTPNDNALIIPMNEGGVNFEVMLNNISTSPSVDIIEHGDSGTRSYQAMFNQKIAIGSLFIALKMADEPWSYDFTHADSVNIKVKGEWSQRKKPLFFASIILLGLTLAWFKVGKAANLLSSPSAAKELPRLNNNTAAPQPVILAPTRKTTTLKIRPEDIEQFLNQMDVIFTRQSNNNQTLFSFKGELDDGTLEQIKKLRNKYLSSNYDFAVNLQDEKKLDKSFKYGEGGYIKISANHWLVNKP